MAHTLSDSFVDALWKSQAIAQQNRVQQRLAEQAQTENALRLMALQLQAQSLAAKTEKPPEKKYHNVGGALYEEDPTAPNGLKLAIAAKEAKESPLELKGFDPKTKKPVFLNKNTNRLETGEGSAYGAGQLLSVTHNPPSVTNIHLPSVYQTWKLFNDSRAKSGLPGKPFHQFYKEDYKSMDALEMLLGGAGGGGKQPKFNPKTGEME